MDESPVFTIGAPVRCRDGDCGVLRRLVVDPVAKVLTHLVVEPKHWSGLGRLVPIERAECADGEVVLDCTLAEFDALEEAEETQFLPFSAPAWGYGPGQMLSLPYFGVVGDDGFGGGQPITYDKVPLGEVDVRRGDPVQASDGKVGRVEGLAVDPSDHRVTHVLLAEGHLWGTKQVAIPIGAVVRVEDGIQLDLTKDQVRDLPPVNLRRP